MQSLRRFVRAHKTLVLSLGFLLAFSVTVVKATPPVSPYGAGITLDPSCIPGSTNCTVLIGGGGGSSQWTTSGSNIFYNTGNVGIGTATPATLLDINGVLTSKGIAVNGTSVTTTTQETIDSPDSISGDIIYDPNDNLGTNHQGYQYIADGTNSLNYRVYAYKEVAGAFGGGRIYSSTYISLDQDITDDSSGNHFGVDLNWDAVPGASGYLILFSDGGSYDQGYEIASSGTFTQEFVDGGYINGYTDSSPNCDRFGCFVGFRNSSTATPTSTPLVTSSIVNSIVGGLSVSGNLHTNNSILSTGAFDSTGDAVPLTSPGSVLMWFPSRAVFRAGYSGSSWNNSNDGNYSAAFGNSTLASGTASFAAGGNTTAGGADSTAFGVGTQALGLDTFAAGFDTVANAAYDTVIGFGNSGGGDAIQWIDTDPLFEIGNGVSHVPEGPFTSGFHDAFEVLKDGDTIINGNLTVNGLCNGVSCGSYFSSVESGAAASTSIKIGIGNNAPAHLLDVGSSGTTTGTAVAQFINAGGTCTITPSTTGGITCTSDMTLKKNINDLSDGSPWSFNSNITVANQDVLDKVLALTPVNYNWNVEQDSDQKHAGFIAQDVLQVFPDLVSADNNGLLSLNYTGLIPYTVEAIKEMNVSITSIDDLTKTDTWRDALTNWFADTQNGIKNFFSDTIKTNNLCVGTVCVTQQQFMQMVQNSGITPTGSVQSPSDVPPVPDNSSDTQTPATSTPTVTPPDTTQSPQ